MPSQAQLGREAKGMIRKEFITSVIHSAVFGGPLQEFDACS